MKQLTVLLCAAVIACGKVEVKSDATTSAVTGVSSVPSSTTTTTESPADKLRKMTTLREAIEFAKPFMSDEVNKPSVGAVAVAIWGVAHMKFADVSVATDETNFARILKDSESERGKKLCIAGKLVEIAVSNTDFGKVFEGLLYNGNLWRFTAVGSTGDLVEMKPARFCGVAIGKYDYSNSVGGTGHAVQLVGMFDLPENKR